MLGIGFGVTIKDDNDPYIQIAADASYALGHCGAPAGTLTDFFPFGTFQRSRCIVLQADMKIVRYFPNWLVKSWSLKFARDWRWAIRQIHDIPYEAVLHNMVCSQTQLYTQDITQISRKQAMLSLHSSAHS